MTAARKINNPQLKLIYDHHLPTKPEGNIFCVPDTAIKLAPRREEPLWSEFLGFRPDFVVLHH